MLIDATLAGMWRDAVPADSQLLLLKSVVLFVQHRALVDFGLMKRNFITLQIKARSVALCSPIFMRVQPKL